MVFVDFRLLFLIVPHQKLQHLHQPFILPGGDFRYAATGGRLLHLFDEHRLQGRIGEGGMGLVYRAEHTLMKKTVAVKLLHNELGQVGEAVRRFEREAQSASRLNHPNIISVTDFGQTATGEFYLAMEYVPGRSLGDALAHEPNHRMSVARALGIVRQMLSCAMRRAGRSSAPRAGPSRKLSTVSRSAPTTAIPRAAAT